MISRDQAWQLLTEKMQNQNLRRHCLSVEAAMKSLARHFREDEDLWDIVGLLHDGDYEISKSTPGQHTLLMHQWLLDLGETREEILSAILSHNFTHTGQHPPGNNLEWSLYCCDELTGFIVAVALMTPSKTLAEVTVEKVLKKLDQKAFAAAVDRQQIAQCDTRLGIELSEFVRIVLSAMQGVSSRIGL